MRIALDCRTVTAPKTGDRTYALNLARALAEVDKVNEYLLYTAEPTPLTQFEPSTISSVVLPSRLRSTWTPIAFPRDLARRKADVAHVQYIIPVWSPCPIITTIHDVSFKRFPALFPPKHRILLNLLIPWSARRSAAVITGSEATRQDLIELYGIPPEKITVTPYAADDSFQPIDRAYAQQEVQRRLNVPTPFILSVGVLQPRKNLSRLVRAYNRIAKSLPHRLVLVGKQGWANEELSRAVAEAPSGKEPHFTGYVADEDLPLLYAAADVFAYPSLYEGFGLPPLEAMSCGTPVITSNVSSLPEVVGKAAMMVDPYVETSIADALQILLSDTALQSRLSRAGIDQAKQFSWARTARETIGVYQRVFQK